MSKKKSSLSPFPEILDIDITGNCEFGLQNECVRFGQWCQKEHLHDNCPNMTLDNFKNIIDQCKGQKVQIRLSGYTDPNKYWGVEKLLSYCKDNDIVPDIITTGFELTVKSVKLFKEYCGTVIVVWRNSPNTYQALRMLLDAGIKTNLFCSVNQDTLKDLNIRLELRGHDFPKGIDTVIFGLQEPIGVISNDGFISYDDSKVTQFFNLLNSEDFRFKIEISSCFAPEVLNLIDGNNHLEIKPCIAGQQLAYISADMKMMPCRIVNQETKWSADLNTHSIEEAWQSKEFDDFRSCAEQLKANSDCSWCMRLCPCNSQLNQLVDKS